MGLLLDTKLNPFRIPLEDVQEATDNFHEDNIISSGGFGPAYKGQLLRSGELIKIVARKLDRSYRPGVLEFLTEVSMLSDLKHPNVVSMIGFCDEKDEKVIVTSYAAKGSLAYLLDNPNLTWTRRLKICLGVARALSYLHSDEGRDYGVIHRNINSDTILLDEKWEPKLSGFEISIKLLVNRLNEVNLCEPIGMEGYIDPEFKKTGCVTHKSDVYSFGIVLFEVLCGRLALTQDGANRLLAPLARYHHENSTLQDIIHPDLWDQISPRSLLKYSKVAYSCIEEEGAFRPNIHEIVGELEKALEFQLERENLGKSLKHLKIPLADMKLATENFSERYRIGHTEYYTLYKAKLHQFDKENPSFVEGRNKDEVPQSHTTVVIKRILPRDDRADDERDDEIGEAVFHREIKLFTSVEHRNIVTLLGFCVQGSEMVLVIKNLSNVYLTDYLGNDNKLCNLTWEKRLKICIDVAHALNYLHSVMEGQKMIMNYDITSCNIALDENFGAMIADFEQRGFEILRQEGKVCFFNKIFDAFDDYIDLEYEESGKQKQESDVYSFGVMLFEILCGRLAYDPIYLKEGNEGIAFVARRCFKKGTLEKMIDPIIKKETSENSFIPNKGSNKDSLYTFIDIACQCVAKSEDQRPTMEFVVKQLEKALLLQKPIQRPNMDGTVDELEKAPELQFTHKISDKRLRHPWMDESDDELEIELELQLTARLAHSAFYNIEQRTTRDLKELKLEHLKIPLSDILEATENFSKRYAIDFTGYYTLYRVELHHFDKITHSCVEGRNEDHVPQRKSTVIIKRISCRDAKEGQSLFYADVKALTTVKHHNIATLLGFCLEGLEMILVIENLPNGNLDDCLNSHDLHMLTWEKRLKICIDVARTLHYLHYEMEDQKVIIVRDVQSRNIMLDGNLEDENLGAKIVEFGLSIFLPLNQEDEALYLDMICGTDVYIDPEYMNTGKLKRESDVYSFGVVLFELLCGRIAYDLIYYKNGDEGLASVARRFFNAGKIYDMIDPVIKDEIHEKYLILSKGPNKDSLDTYIEIASQCVTETQDQRPSMKIVVKELEKALFFQRNNKVIPVILLEDIKRATQDFDPKNYIGGGGFGKVYKGKLQDGEVSKTIVVKKLYGQGKQQFRSELQILWEYKHENVIGLVGYCDEDDEKIIVYEYASKGTLHRYLDHAALTWFKRLNICVEVASALDFLHGGAGKQAKVVHRDIKTSNILLNHDWKAKLADFGLSLISSIARETDYVIDGVCGTKGYIDPLYEKSKLLTIESDIYSFGVVLFEILYGISTHTIHKQKGQYLQDFVKCKFDDGKREEVVFEQISKQIVPESLITFQDIAYKCLHHRREERPKTKEVLMQLQKALQFQISGGGETMTTTSISYGVQD